MNGSPHYHVSDTGLAAAMATFGIPLVQSLAMTCIVDVESGKEGFQFLFLPAGPIRKESSELLIAAWENPSKHEVQPLEWMRTAFWARKYLVSVIHGIKHPHPEAVKALATARDKLATPNLRDAIIFVANGQQLAGFANRCFIFLDGAQCRAILDQALREHGSSAPQWQHKFLYNFEQMLEVVKSSSTLLRFTNGPKTMLLSADADEKLEDKFHRRFQQD